ncbi:ImuA family protein [Pseudolabrys sp. FHR47]|uniref:ImuA family protein n=1 Tax=Pseudolabrys sp. FHR47 TaxID=2562284 RepID=UPI0010BE2BDA|nr:DNA repair protein [Pseudolabrys sp. FHR47]
MLDALRQQLTRLQKPAGLAEGPAVLPLDVSAVDDVLGGGLLRGALHEIAAAGEAHLPAATGFTLGLAALAGGNKHLVWIAEDMALAESGVPYGAALEAFGLSPKRLVIVSAAHRHELMAAMEEALHCRAVGVVLGEMRNGPLDAVAVRRLSLAAGDSGALALLLRAQPAHDASTAATRWTVQAAPSAAPGHREFGAPRFAVHLTRNRRGPSASWILEWRNPDDRFVLATHAEPVAAPLRHRPHQKVA